MDEGETNKQAERSCGVVINNTVFHTYKSFFQSFFQLFFFFLLYSLFSFSSFIIDQQLYIYLIFYNC